jgi:SAM-dependent methyltransferase
MWRRAPWKRKTVLDIGCGTGFHLPRFAAKAGLVIGVEPHKASLRRAAQRVEGLPTVSVRLGSAERLPVNSASVDVAHARFAYFWDARAAPGLGELERVMRPGGTAFVIDNDWSWGQFATWLRRSPSNAGHDEDAIEDFWRRQGFTTTAVHSEWRFVNRADLERVIHLEFPPATAEEILRSHQGTAVPYGYLLRHRSYRDGPSTP